MHNQETKPSWMAVVLLRQSLQNVPEDQPYIGTGREILLLRTEDGFHALDNTCPHASAPIGAATFDGETVTCRRHFMRFDVRTGVCPDAPSWSVQSYPIRVQDGVVEVGL